MNEKQVFSILSSIFGGVSVIFSFLWVLGWIFSLMNLANSCFFIMLIFGFFPLLIVGILNVFRNYRKEFIKELEDLVLSTKQSRRAKKLKHIAENEAKWWSKYTTINIYISELDVNDFDKLCNEIIFLFMEEYICGCIFRGNKMDKQCVGNKRDRGTNKRCNPFKVTENVLNALSDNKNWRSKLSKNKGIVS